MNQIFEFSENNSDLIRRYPVIGSRRLSNFFWAGTLGIGGFYFLLTGLSSYFGSALLPFLHFDTIVFFPQGIVMCFYGSLSILQKFQPFLANFCAIGQIS